MPLTTPLKQHVMAVSFLGTLLLRLNLGDGLDDTDSNRLTHVTDSESAKRRVLRESLDAHWLGRGHDRNARITVLDELWGGLDDLTRTTIHLLGDLLELARDVSRVAVQHWGITVVLALYLFSRHESLRAALCEETILIFDGANCSFVVFSWP